MKNNFFLLLMLSTFLLNQNVFWSQKIDTAIYNGKTYFVYPFKEIVRANDTYFQTLDTKSIKNIIASYSDLAEYQNLSTKEKKKYNRQVKKQMKHISKMLRLSKISDNLKKAIEKNPFPLLEKTYSLDKDIVPCLDKIPDGEYIQYYEHFPLNKEKGKHIDGEKLIAGIFSIKNNMLHGKAVWLNIAGDTLKNGVFENGLKEGEWKLEIRKLTNRQIDEESEKNYIKNGKPFMDTIREFVTYKNGSKNGYYKIYENSFFPTLEGNYVNNEKTGSWIERKQSIIIIDDYYSKKEKNNSVITAEYTINDSKKITKQPIIRMFLVEDGQDNQDYNFLPKYTPYNLTNNLYTMKLDSSTVNEDELNITTFYPEEETEYDEEYPEDGISDYSNENYYNNYNSYDLKIYDLPSKTYISKNKLIDSLGILFNYKGVYERHYPNGQLMFRYRFENDQLVIEDTLFWDNGKAYDIVYYHTDSNQFIRSIYDYDGKLYKELVYDKKGIFLRIKSEPPTFEMIELRGKQFVNEFESSFYYYDKSDSVEYQLDKDSICLWYSINKADKLDNYTDVYFPKDRVLKASEYTINGNKRYESEVLFGETFLNWTGNDSLGWDKLSLKSVRSGIFKDYPFQKDSVPVHNISNYEQLFDISSDKSLYVENKLFSGPLELNFNSNKPKFEVGKTITLSLQNEINNSLNKDYIKYKNTGKSTYSKFYNFLKIIELNDSDFNSSILMFFDHIYEFYAPLDNYEYYNYETESGEPKKYKERELPLFTKKITGKYINGKPSGKWLFFDQFDRVMCEAFYINGEIEGEVRFFDEQKTPKKNKKLELEEFNYNPNNSILQDSLPKKDIYFLKSTTNYKKDLRQGLSTMYNWYGEIVQQENFKDDYLEGKVIERNKIAYTTSNYRNGAIDGYLETYLTLPGKDSIQLYSINFKEGMLQGESKSFHLNGKLSKKGFFLNGLPIDDYEAFDSLGTKYHYVKFLYSFPIEEKIWEENQLSIRYTFDWQDSIFFRPSDITSSQTLERQLADLGIGMEYFNRPYYGRPSLVNKNGIKYGLTKYYPNDTIARDGLLDDGKKIGLWKFYNYYGKKLYEVKYVDSIVKLNDSINFNSKGIYSQYDTLGNLISKSYIIEKYEKYDCSHSDHYEIRQFFTFWEKEKNTKINGYVKNYYDNGVLQSEGNMKNGLPEGVWKFYDPYGKLNHVGMYVLGKREGRWLGGDLSKTKYLGDICLNPNLPDLEETMKIREKQLDITITNYKMGKPLNKEFYDVDWSKVEIGE